MVIRDEDALWLAAITTLSFLLYGYHLIRCIGWFRRERHRQAFRALFIAIMIELLQLRVIVGSLVRALPYETWLVGLQTVIAPLLTLMWFSGGFVLWWTWRRKV
jgi:hypothetical protein